MRVLFAMANRMAPTKVTAQNLNSDVIITGVPALVAEFTARMRVGNVDYHIYSVELDNLTVNCNYKLYLGDGIIYLEGQCYDEDMGYDHVGDVYDSGGVTRIPLDKTQSVRLTARNPNIEDLYNSMGILEAVTVCW